MAYDALGAVLSVAGNYPEALVWRKKEMEIFEKIAAQNPANLNARRNIALATKYVAGLLEVTGAPEQAREMERRAVSLDRSRTETSEPHAQATLDLSYSYGALGENLATAGLYAEAVENLQNALQLSEGALLADPQNAAARTTSAADQVRLASALLGEGKPALALAAAEKSVASHEAMTPSTVVRAWIARGLTQAARAHNALAAAGSPAERASHSRAACNAVERSEKIRLEIEKSGEFVAPYERVDTGENQRQGALCVKAPALR
jgi:tetratricopeptide (TPR) repeat protein